MKRGEEVESVSSAHGLFQVTRLIQHLLDGVVAFYGAALDHLDRKEGGDGYFLSSEIHSLIYSLSFKK